MDLIGGRHSRFMLRICRLGVECAPRHLAMMIFVVALITCGAKGCKLQNAHAGEVCGGYPNWKSSRYVLPYSVGDAFRVIQGNCAPPGNGHRGVNRYSYDFGVSIGTPFLAARGGTVVEVEQSHFDGQIAPTGLDNYIVIRHDDGTAALYGHLTHDGATVKVGDVVRQGAALGRSGNTGNTANIPHLHFSVQACDPVTGGSDKCPTIPITFRNTDSNPHGLKNGRTYKALPYVN
jgi:murein DD-endopeptidase MepM/ murein hydrolase activator NlpD